MATVEHTTITVKIDLGRTGKIGKERTATTIIDMTEEMREEREERGMVPRGMEPLNVRIGLDLPAIARARETECCGSLPHVKHNRRVSNRAGLFPVGMG